MLLQDRERNEHAVADDSRIGASVSPPRARSMYPASNVAAAIPQRISGRDRGADFDWAIMIGGVYRAPEIMSSKRPVKS